MIHMLCMRGILMASLLLFSGCKGKAIFRTDKGKGRKSYLLPPFS